jgi:phosphoribosylglycinamide formyltransferase-1
MTLPIVVLISGKGSNLAAILEAMDHGRCDVQVRAVLSDRDSAEGLAQAHARGIATAVVRMKDHADRERWNEALASAIVGYEPAVVVLAGFMRVLGAAVVRRFAGRIVNVHPALLPLFPGTDGPAQAIRAGVRVSGCSVHVVDEGVDTGPILAQAVVPVLPDDDADRLHERIKRVEHALLPAVLHAVARGHIVLGERPRVSAACFDAEAALSSLRS